MLFLVQLEHKNGYLITHLIRAKDVTKARNKLEDWLSEDFAARDGDWYISPDGDGVKVTTIAKIQSLYDLTKWLPLIE